MKYSDLEKHDNLFFKSTFQEGDRTRVEFIPNEPMHYSSFCYGDVQISSIEYTEGEDEFKIFGDEDLVELFRLDEEFKVRIYGVVKIL